LKKWHAEMRKKPKSYHNLQSRRFLKARSYNYETSNGYQVRSLHELLVTENLIANGVPHMYEPALRCGNHTLFPDFVADTVVGRVIIEVSGFRAPHMRVRLSEKLKLYLSQRVADRILVVHLERDRETAQKVA
jgi:predicted nuclease of restriction endonuclease-like RecB superfamily